MTWRGLQAKQEKLKLLDDERTAKRRAKRLKKKVGLPFVLQIAILQLQAFAERLVSSVRSDSKTHKRTSY